MAEPDIPASLCLRLFGPMNVRVRGQAMPPLRIRKEQWLLALLVLRAGREVERSWLAGLLWPDTTESTALSNLRRGLTDLRAALGPEAYRLTSPTVRTLRLDLEGAWADVQHYDAAIAADDPGSLLRAVELYAGPLLEGCVEEWVAQERQSREEAYLAALETLAGADLERGDPAGAARRLRQAVSVDPLRESAQRELMRALAASGSHAAAILTYRELRSRLHEELNAAPDPATAALFQQIRADARRAAEVTAARVVASREPAHAGSSRSCPPEIECDEDEEELEALSESAADFAAPPAVAPSSAPAPPEPSSRHLPIPLTELVGREEELEQVTCLFEDARLVTLTGPGGVGKTRLAIRAAEELDAGFAGGAWFVDLTAVPGPGLLARAVAAAFGVADDARDSDTAALVRFLRSREVLLVLDNCEHLVEPCARLAQELLGACPGVRILATSRQALGLTGEVTWPVPSLPLPEGSGLTLRELCESPAVRLFLERGRAVAPSFQLTPATAPAVAHLVCRLDGIPLAIELAAARLRSLSVEQIAARLDDRFRLLTGGSRAALPRQQTLLATMDWSYDLLSQPERLLLRRLGAFIGSFTLEAAQAVCSDGEPAGSSPSIAGWTAGAGSWHSGTAGRQPFPHGEPRCPLPSQGGAPASGHALDAFDVIELLAQLVERSLVQVSGYGSEELRYRLLETTRQYAREQWAAGEAERILGRHARYYVELAQRCDAELEGPRQGSCLDELETELDNLRAALQWLSREDAPEEDVQQGLLLGAALWRFWRGRGYLTEGRRWLARALSRSSVPTAARAHALLGSGVLAVTQGFMPASRILMEESLELFRALEDQEGILLAREWLGYLLSSEDYCAEAARLHLELLEEVRPTGDTHRVAANLTFLAWAYYMSDRPEEGLPYIREAVELRRAQGDDQGLSRALNLWGLLLKDLERRSEARPLLEEAIALARKLRCRAPEGSFVRNLASTILYDAPREAEACYAFSLAHDQDMGVIWSAAQNLRGIALCVDWRGLTEDNALWVARLLGAAEKYAERFPYPMNPIVDTRLAPLLERVQPLVKPERFTAAWTEGREMPLEQAVELALSWMPRPESAAGPVQPRDGGVRPHHRNETPVGTNC